jgi:hypothetical protein
MFDIFRFCFHSFEEVYSSIDSSRMIGNSPEVFNFNGYYFSNSIGSFVLGCWFSSNALRNAGGILDALC